MKRTLWVIVMLSMALTFSGCVADNALNNTPITTPSFCTISGVVTSEENPLDGVAVEVTWSDDGTSYSATALTNNEGLYSIGVIPLGSATVRIDCELYKLYEESVVLEQNAFIKDIALTPLNLPSITGMVVNWYDHNPVGGVIVKVSGCNAVVTEKDGTFIVHNVRDTDVSVTVPETDIYEWSIKDIQVTDTVNDIGEICVFKKIKSLCPTNGEVLTTGTPVFEWEPYECATSYSVLIEARLPGATNSNSIWWVSDIENTSLEFNFDGTASSELSESFEYKLWLFAKLYDYELSQEYFNFTVDLPDGK